VCAIYCKEHKHASPAATAKAVSSDPANSPCGVGITDKRFSFASCFRLADGGGGGGVHPSYTMSKHVVKYFTRRFVKLLHWIIKASGGGLFSAQPESLPRKF